MRDLDTENIAELAVRARALGDVIPLWYGEGDDVTSEAVRAAAKRALDEGTTFYVPDMRGLPALTEELSAYLTRLYGRTIPVERSTITPGGMQALYLGLSSILEVGTNAVYLEPQWPNIARTIFMLGAEPRPVPLAFDTDFRLDLDQLFAACDARTRAVVLSTPSNPTGWTASLAEFEALLAFSRRTGIWIVSDEVYGRLYFEGEAAPSILEVSEEDDRVLVVNSFSKAWAMTGWRVGWLNHPVAVASEIAAMIQYMNSGTAAFIQAGALEALRNGEPQVRAIRAKLKAGMDLAYRGTADGYRPSSCPTSRAAACTRSSPWPMNPIRAKPASASWKRRASALHRGSCSAIRRARFCACASCGTMRSVAIRARPDGRSLLMTRISSMISWQRRSLLAAVAVAVLATPAPVASPAFAVEPLNVGAYPANPPWEYKAADGHFEGFEVDVVNDVAKRLSTTASRSRTTASRRSSPVSVPVASPWPSRRSPSRPSG